MATRENLSFTLGETWPIELDCKDAAGAPLDLTGGSVRFRVINALGVVALDLSSPSAGVVIDAAPSTGKAVITVTPALQTSGQLVGDVYDYEARATLADSSVSDQAYGVINVRGTLF